MASGDGYFYSVDKLTVNTVGALGSTGEWRQCLRALESICANGIIDEELDVTVLELRGDSIWLYDGHEKPFQIKQDFYAIGTGAAYAIAAMHLGKSPKEAVEIAALYDPGTGGPIETIEMEENPNAKGKRR